MATLENLDKRVLSNLFERLLTADSLGKLILLPRKSSALFPSCMRVSVALLSQELQKTMNEQSSKQYKVASCENMLKQHANKLGFEVRRLKFGVKGTRRHNNCILLPWDLGYEPSVKDVFQLLFPSFVPITEDVQGSFDQALSSSPDLVRLPDLYLGR